LSKKKTKTWKRDGFEITYIPAPTLEDNSCLTIHYPKDRELEGYMFACECMIQDLEKDIVNKDGGGKE